MKSHRLHRGPPGRCHHDRFPRGGPDQPGNIPLEGSGAEDGWRGGAPPRKPGGRGGRRRQLDAAELRIVLLKLIADQPRHGYDLIRAVEDLTGGGYAPSPGVVYPTLTMLEEMDHIARVGSEGTRKAFTATAQGRAVLDDEAPAVAGVFARLARLAARHARTDAAPIRRAMDNLRTALMDRLGRDGVGIDAIHAAAAILDEATQRIERLPWSPVPPLAPPIPTESPMSNTSAARVPTANASRYLQQLCKHWNHTLLVDFTPERGSVVFPRNARGADWPGDATLVLTAHADALECRLEASCDEQLTALQGVVASHLDRFAFREAPLRFDWQAA